MGPVGLVRLYFNLCFQQQNNKGPMGSFWIEELFWKCASFYMGKMLFYLVLQGKNIFGVSWKEKYDKKSSVKRFWHSPRRKQIPINNKNNIALSSGIQFQNTKQITVAYDIRWKKWCQFANLKLTWDALTSWIIHLQGHSLKKGC